MRAMKCLGPAGLEVHVLYIIALARFAQAVSLYYREFRRRFEYKGLLDNLITNWVLDEEALAAIPREPEELRLGKREEFRLSVLKRVK